MSDYSLTLTRQLPVDPETVFDAWTTPEQMANWFSPTTRATVPKLDLRVGGEYRIDMHGEDKDFVHTGKYIEIDRPNRLVFSWFSESTGQKETIVTLDFEAKDGGTFLTLTHERFATVEAQKAHQGGWTAIFEKLAEAMSLLSS